LGAVSGAISDISRVALTRYPDYFSSIDEDGITRLVYLFSRTGDTSNALTIDFNVSGSAAFVDDYLQSGADFFSNTGGSLTFAPGSASAYLELQPVNDIVPEGDETIAISLLTGPGYEVESRDEVIGTINDDGISISIYDTILPEGNSGTSNATFHVSLSRSIDTPISLSYSTADGTATASDNDYSPTLSTILTFNPGESYKSISIPVIGDSKIDGARSSYANESFFVNLSNLQANGRRVTLADAQGQAFINNDDGLHWNLSRTIQDPTPGGYNPFGWRSVGISGNKLLVSDARDTKLEGVYIYDLETGELRQQLHDPNPVYGDSFGWHSAINGDHVLVANERNGLVHHFSAQTGELLNTFGSSGYNYGFRVDISGLNGLVSGGVGMSSVYDLGAGQLLRSFNYSGPGAINGSNVLVSDHQRAYLYDLESGTLLQTFIKPSAVTNLGLVDIDGDRVLIGDERLAYLFSASTGDLLQTFVAPNTGSSYNDSNIVINGNRVLLGPNLFDAATGDLVHSFISPEPANSFGSTVAIEGDNVFIGSFGSASLFQLIEYPLIDLDLVPARVAEDGTTNLVFTFTRTGPTTSALTVNYGITGTADATDYTGATPGAGKTITFAAGSATASLAIDPTVDSTFEGDDTVLLTLAAGTGYTLGTTAAVMGTILNDDFPQVSVTAIANGNEANGSPAVFRFSRTDSTTDPLSVSYRLLGTAQAGSDYSGATTGTISFSAGSAIAELSLPALADSVVDPGETIIAQIVPSTAATPSYLITPGQQTATATITAEGMVVKFNGPSRPSKSIGEFRNFYRFAALKGDGTVVSWGDPNSGGVTPAGLVDVTQIFSTSLAFAALKSNGTVVSWGNPSYGGTAPAGLSGVTQIFSTFYAFAALKNDGTVVCWGIPNSGGTTPAGLGGVTQIFSTIQAFAALKSNGTVVSWGDPSFGGTTPSGLDGVTQIFSNTYAFAALKSDGTVVSWGDPAGGGTPPAGLDGVTQIFSNSGAFAALKIDGSVVCWGSISHGSTTPSGLSGVTQIFSTDTAFAALKSDGTVVSWGDPRSGGTTPSGLGSVTQIFSTETAFAALKSDGTVVSWGYDLAGGTAPPGLSGVTQIFSNSFAFAALKSDGTVVSWGNPSYGGTAPEGLGGVTQIFSAHLAFAALKSDGTVVSWGDYLAGGTAPAGLSGVVGFANPFTDDRLLLPQPPLPTLEAPTIDPLTGDDFLTVSEYENGLLISGSGQPGAIVTIGFEDSLLPAFGGDIPPSYNVSVGSDGQWALALSAAQVGLLGVGDDIVIATQSWPASDVVSEAAYRLFFIEGAPAPSIAAISGDDLITIAEALAGFTIQGTGVPGATILLAFSSGTSAEAGATTVVDLEGNWSLSITPEDVYGFGEGVEIIEVSQQLSGTGFTSGVSNRSFAIEPAPVPTVDVIAADDILSPEESQLGFSITGSGVPGATIIILFASGITPEAGSSAEVDPTGQWSLLVSPSDLARIGPINESIDVYQVITQLGLTSSAVSHDFLIEDAPAPTINAITGDDSISASDLRSGFVISGRGLAGSTIHLEFDSGTVLQSGPTALVGTDGSWTVAVVQVDVIGFDLGLETILISQTIPGVGFTSGVVSHIFTVEAINLPPTGVALNNAVTGLEENTPTLAAIKLADIAISDDALGSNTISLTGADAAFFEVVGSGLFLKAGTSLNYEAKASYGVTVSVSDPTVAGSVPVTASYALAITDVNEAPTAVVLNNAVTGLEENTPTLAAIKLADIAISDDALGSNTISLTGADAAFFEVVGTGLFLKAGISLNYEAKASYGVTVSVTDPTVAGSVPVTASYALAITDVNEAPTAVVLNNRLTSLEENTPTLAAIKLADIAISDDGLGSNTISLTGADAAFFEVVGTGLFLKAGTSLNYETKASYAVTVSVSDPTVAGSVPVTASYALAVRDLNEAPTALNLSATAFDENIVAGSQIALLSANDPDSTPQSFSYALVSGTGSTHNLFFSLAGNALRITRSPDYETRSTYSIRLRTTDQGGLSFERSVALSVNDIPDSPTYSFSKSADIVYERGALAIGVSTTNVSAGTRIYWSFSGTNITAGDFSDGQLLGSVSLGEDGKASLTKVVAADGSNEADETLEVKFFSDAGRSQQVGTTLSITLKDPVVGVVSDGPDIITGTSANEVLTGVPTSSILRGRGTVDRLTGGGGNDQFLLGDRNGAFYNDGDPATDGSADIAVITDFNAGDSIALFGAASLYQLSRGSYSSTAGLWIQMLPTGGGLSERIGFVQGATLSTLSLGNTSQFTYLNP
jgi:hypothetical protein